MSDTPPPNRPPNPAPSLASAPATAAPAPAPSPGVLDNRQPGAAPGTKPAGALSARAWEPMKFPLYRSIWTASLLANIGIWAQSLQVGPWLMRTLSPSPVIVTLVAVAANLPIALLSLHAGAMTDVFDRKRLLIFTQLWMMAATALLGALCLVNLVTPGVLLVVTFLLGIGTALSGPAFQAIVPELVPPGDMPLAVALNSVALNLARAIGPAVAGVVIARFGIGPAVLLNAATFIVMVGSLVRWKRPSQHGAVRPEGVWRAIGIGFKYARHSVPLLAVLLRVFIFIVCGVALWAMTALVAKDQLRAGASGMGFLMGSLGLGAVVGVFAMPELQRRLSIDGMVNACTLAYAAGVIALSRVHSLAAGCGLMVFIGFNWVIVPTNFNIATQRSVPNWVKGRALSMYLTVLFGSWSLGSFIWGSVAQKTRVETALLWSGVGVAAGVALGWPIRLTLALGADFAAAAKGPAPVPPPGLETPPPGAGDVRVSVEYVVDPQRAGDFVALMRELQRQRLRNGASHWHLSGEGEAARNGPARPAGGNGAAESRGAESGAAGSGGRFVESYRFASWADRLRHQERTTRGDALLQEQARAFHLGAEPPSVVHDLAPRPSAGGAGGRVAGDPARDVVAGVEQNLFLLLNRLESRPTWMGPRKSSGNTTGRSGDRADGFPLPGSRGKLR